MKNTFTAVYEKNNGFYVGYAKEIPGANVYGETIDEAREKLREKIRSIMLSSKEFSEDGLREKDHIQETIVVSIEG